MRSNQWLNSGLQLSAWLVAGILLCIVFFLFSESIPLVKEIGLSPFFNDKNWNPTEGQFQLTAMLLGSIYIAAGSVLIATPLGIAVALFGQFYAPPIIANFYRGLMELLAGVPSVVFGFWGLVVIVPWIAKISPPGASTLAGIIVLSLMILPLVALTADASIKQVPLRYFNSAKAMGIGRWGIIRKIAIPQAFPSILSGIVLQTGRALGETMAVLMVCGNVVQIPSSLFQPVRTLTANIALEMSYALDQHRAALFVSGLLLLLITIALFILVNFLKSTFSANTIRKN